MIKIKNKNKMENKISINVKMIEEAWGKPSFSSGLDFFKQSHSVVNKNKFDLNDLTIISLDEVLSEMLKTNKSE